MADFSVFDSILDAAFILDEGGTIVYCNDAAATFCQSSVRRLVGKAKIETLIRFDEGNLLPLKAGSNGYAEPTPFIETQYSLLKGEKTGKVQLAIRPLGDNNWFLFVRDVGLEEALHSKYRSELSQKEGYILDLEEARRKLEDYSRNLEKLVEERTSELRSVNQTLKAILNSLGQGFFTFNPDGDCGPVFTRACGEILGGLPENKKVWQVLRVPEGELEFFNKWMASLFQEPLPFDDLKTLGPSLFPHAEDRFVNLQYYPIRDEKDSVAEVVVVATDKTAEHQAQIQLEAERQFAAMIVNYIRNKERFLKFLASAGEAIQNLAQEAPRQLTTQDIQDAFRKLHTLEGEAGTFCVEELRSLARVVQHILEPHKTAASLPSEAQTRYREAVEQMGARFSAFLNENQNIFQLQRGRDGATVEVPTHFVEQYLADLKSRLSLPELRGRFLELFCKVPIESRLTYFDSLIQSVAKKVEKRTKPLVIKGGDIRIYPEPYQDLFASLVHAFRNAVDHGIEPPEEREWSGKDPEGSIQIQVEKSDRYLKIVIHDDGRGIDPAVIRKKLQSKSPELDPSNLSDQEVIQYVCLPGFSSRDEVGEFSGRGVGLDALREEVLKLGGKIHLQSEVGKGTQIEILVPELDFETQILRSA